MTIVANASWQTGTNDQFLEYAESHPEVLLQACKHDEMWAWRVKPAEHDGEWPYVVIGLIPSDDGENFEETCRPLIVREVSFCDGHVAYRISPEWHRDNVEDNRHSD